MVDLLVLAAPAWAQLPLTGVGAGAETIVSYPLDGVANVFDAWSSRRLLSSFHGPSIKLQCKLGGAQQDFTPDNIGDFPTAAAVTWCPTDDYRQWLVVKMYGQANNNDLPAGCTNMAILVPTFMNGRPVIYADSQSCLVTPPLASVPAGGSARTVMAVLDNGAGSGCCLSGFGQIEPLPCCPRGTCLISG